MYQLTRTSSVTRLLDMASIPADPANSDYATYLKWLNGYTETIRAPGTWTPEVPATFDAEGNELTAAIPGYWTEGEILEVIEHPPHTPEPYVPPPVPVPASVNMWRARVVLNRAGLLNAVFDAIEAMPEPARTDAKIIWEFAPEVDRYFGFVPAIAYQLGLTDKQLDELFIAASQLKGA